MLKIKEILEKLDVIEFIGDKNIEINCPKKFDANNTAEDVIMWVNEKNNYLIEQLTFGTVICGSKVDSIVTTANYIIVENPRLFFKNVLEYFFLKQAEPVISKKASIHPSVRTGDTVNIGDFAIIEEGCVIGDNTSIGHNTVVKSETIIGNNVSIGSNCTIGGVGFGYEKDIDGDYSLMPHLGNVVIKDQVEIGNNVCIDRAVLGSTKLEENVKIDNLVHVAHGVQIGKNSLIIANAMIAGSTIIEENVWVAPSSSILNTKRIGANSVIGMGAVVVKDVINGQVIVGNPGKPL